MHFGSEVRWWNVLLFLHSVELLNLRGQTCQRCSWFHLSWEPTKDKSHSLNASFKNNNIKGSPDWRTENRLFLWWGFEEICFTTGEQSCLQTDQFPGLEPTLLPLLGCDLTVSGISETYRLRGYELSIECTFQWIGSFSLQSLIRFDFYCFLLCFFFMLSELMWEFVRKDKGPAPEVSSTKPHLSHMQDGCRGSWEIQPGPEFK